MATKQEIITLINGTIIENVRGQITADSVKEILTDIATEMVGTTEFDEILDEQVNQLETIKDEAIAASQVATSDYIDKGTYNVPLNIPTLSSNATIGGGIKPQKYIVDVAGSISFAGYNFVSGSAFNIGDELRQHISGSWYRNPASDAAYKKVVTLESTTRVIDILPLNFTGQALNGGTISTVSSSLTVPNGVTGYSTYIQLSIPNTTKPEWKVGNTIRFELDLLETVPGSSNTTSPKVQLNVIRSGSTVEAVSTSTFVRLTANSLRYTFDYVVLSTDENFRPVIQLRDLAVNSGVSKTWICTSVVASVIATSSGLTPVSNKFSVVESAIQSNSSSIASNLSSINVIQSNISVPNKVTENYSKVETNGGVVTTAPAVITIPVGTSGGGSALTRTMQRANHPEFVTGSTLKFYVIFDESVAGIRNTKLDISLNVNRGAGTITNQASNKVNNVVGTHVTTTFEYVVQSSDVWVQPVVQIIGTGITNGSGSPWTFTVQNIYVEVTNPVVEVNNITARFNMVDTTTQTLSSSISTQQLDIANKLINGSVVPTGYNGQALNGATGNSSKRVTIPSGSTGNSSYVRAILPIEEFSDWSDMVSIPVSFSYKVLTSTDFYPTKSLTFTLTVTRTTGDVTGSVSGVSIDKLSATVLQVNFTYIPTVNDLILRPYIQTSGAGGTVSADSFFEMQEITYSHVIPLGFKTENNYITSKDKTWYVPKIKSLESRATTLESNVTSISSSVVTNTTDISDRTLNSVVFPTSWSGQGVNGGTGSNTSKVSIPSGSTGNSSYVRAVIPISEFPTWSDTIGVPVTISYKVAMSTDFYPNKGFTSVLTVTRSGSDVTGSISGNTITKLSANVLRVRFTYTPDANDTVLKPYIQTSGAGVAVTSDSYFEIQDITYSHAIPTSHMSTSTYVQAKEKSSYNSKISGLDGRLTTAESTLSTIGSSTRTVKTVKPDGTGDYLSPKLANDAITDSSASKQYDIVIYPGVYTEVEWKSKPYMHWRGIDNKSCWLKGELPENADDTHRTTSTLWLVKTASLTNLKITAKNMRYAVHSEESGANSDAIHNVYNCYIEHYGNDALTAWRTANPGSGLTTGNVWASARPWGYGAASGLVENYENTVFASGQREAYYVHSNLNFSKPNINTLKNCRLVRSNWGQVVAVESLGSGQSDMVNMYGCSITPGYARHTDSPWISQAADNQYANHANYSLFMSGCSPIGYRDATRGTALRIKSNSSGSVSTVRVSGSAVSSLFGSVFEKDGCTGLQGYTYGYWDISGILVGLNSDVTVNNTIGRRLGNCTSVNKILNVVIDGSTNVNITFNQDYTAQSNSTILSTINSSLGSSAVADAYNPALGEYYPEFEDRIITLFNSGTIGIPRFNAVGYNTDRTNIRLLTTSDVATKFIGVAIDNIPINTSGRVLISGILEKNIQIPGVTGTVSMDTDISLSSTVNGQFELSSSKVVMKGIATDWAQFNIK